MSRIFKTSLKYLGIQWNQSSWHA